jgi:glyoxylase-like metal-dependent hydrolase (beta-lactamase superfamily II)
MLARIDRVTGTVNTWIVGDDDEVIVIDPGESAEAVLEVVGDRDVLAVICTHGHARHVAAAFEVAKRDEAPVALHRADKLAWREAHHGTEPDIFMEDGGRFEVSDVSLEVISAPGHSSGSVCLYSMELGVLFTGDVVTERGPVPHEGKFTDFSRQMDAIGAGVLTLDSEARILPGHGEELTISTADRRFDTWVSAGPEGLLEQDEADDAD